ncbi:MFS transporter [Flavipsychrobacter stenotrophus]|uniref:MFS transporter n=1 Tax=Flavipsychrobacter stenotrophus TaxID=2077091 RepID=A0A2S7SXF4_9BACT|nr:MFS transporter [Flavipsychrobacter stenotrophus]PQJ11287.1 MFS transporter [Flavipsychrobacter stenotrophus]
MSFVPKVYKNAYSGLSPATWWLSVVMLINRSGTMVVPFMTLYMTQALHYNIAKAGMVMAIFGAGAVCGGFLGGRLTDKFGFYNIQLSALLCGGAMFIVLGQMTSYLAICICTFVLAVLNESFRPANSTAIAQYSNEENRTRCYSLNRLSINLGFAVGSAIGGFIASRDYHLIFWIDGLTNIGAALLLRTVLSPQRNVQTPSKKDKQSQPKVKGRSPYADKQYMFFVLLTIMFAYTFFQLFTTVPIFYKNQLKLSEFTIGSIMALNGLIIAIVEMVLIFKLEQKKKNLQFISLGIFLVAVSFLVYNVIPGMLMVALISTLFITAGEMLSMPFMNSFMISRTDENNRGQYAGLFTVAWSIAQVIGPYTGTLIADTYGFNSLWWCIVAMSVATALGFRYLQYRVERKNN